LDEELVFVYQVEVHEGGGEVAPPERQVLAR
jgi:hypothetical protein